MDESNPTAPRGVSAEEFFSASIPGGSMTQAHYDTRIAYTTIHRAAHGAPVSASTAKALERWSRDLGVELYISAAATLRLDEVAS